MNRRSAWGKTRQGTLIYNGTSTHALLKCCEGNIIINDEDILDTGTDGVDEDGTGTTNGPGTAEKGKHFSCLSQRVHDGKYLFSTLGKSQFVNLMIFNTINFKEKKINQLTS